VDALLDQAVSAERERLADQALYSRLWELQTRSWQRMLRTYLLDEVDRAKAQGNRPALFELAFGLRPAQAGRCDTASTPEAVTIKLGGVDVRLHGKIDRVDFIGPEELPQAIDYKTGALPAAGDLAAGRELQLALYASALEQLLKKPCQGGVYHDVEELKKLYLTRDKVSGGRGREMTYEQAMTTALEAAGRYIQAMAGGRFAVAPAKGCAKYCPYRQVCQYSQARAARKGERTEGEDDAA
jgi:ATP-dependent helicase/DNAse subunit B